MRLSVQDAVGVKTVSSEIRTAIMLWIFGLLLAGSALAGGQATDEGTNVDVMQNEKAVLHCRFDSELAGEDPASAAGGVGGVSFYWSHKNFEDWDTVAIQESLFREQYSVDFDPAEGRYDLHISSATYENDNGQFVCKVRRVGTGSDLHTARVNLTVLMPPNPPSIVLEEHVLNEGRPAVLECSSDGGSPPPEVGWYRRGTSTPLPAEWSPAADRSLPTISRLTLEPTREDDGQQLECVVHNRAMAEGERFTALTELDVNYYPRIAVGPESPLRVELGRVAELQCTVDAKPAVSNVRWIRNNAFISTEFALVIDQVAHDDAGAYTCSAHNDVAESKEDLVLDVLYAPRVSVEESREVPTGGSVQILCEADANPPVEDVFWLREDDPEFRSEGATLRLSRVTAADNGNYVCVAVNSVLSYGMAEAEQRFGNATTSILIRHAPGQAFISPETPIGVEGRPLTLTCSTSPPGHPTPKYVWTRASRPGVPLGFGANLTIDPVDSSAAGEYTCEPENALGRGSPAAVVVDVFRAPELVTRLPEEETHPSEMTAFEATCSAEGMPKPSVRWLKDGVEVSTAGGRYDVSIDETELGERVFSVRSVLHFRGGAREKDRLTAADRGNYTCQFQNPAGTAGSTMLLRIRHAPVVYHQYQKVAFDEDEEALIVCQMVAYPAPTFHWSRQGAPLDSDLTDFYGVNSTQLGNDVHESSLRLAHVRQQDYGQYVCQAQNAEGEHSTALTLQPKGRPEPPSDVRSAEVGTGWALLDWTPGFEGGFTDTIYYVSVVDEKGKERAFDCQTRRPCNVTSLQHRTTYRVKIRAANDGGDSVYSEQTQFTTALDLRQLPQPESVKFEPQSRRLNFNVVGTAMDVVGLLEVRSDDSGWIQTEQMVDVTNNFGNAEVESPLGEVADVRVRLCLSGNHSVCGAPVLANHVDVSAVVVPGAGIPLTTIIIIVVAVLLALVVVITLLICCRRRNNTKKTSTKNFNDEVYSGQKLSGYYPPAGVPDNKQTVDTTDLARMNQESSKAAIYGSRPGYEHGAHPDGAAGAAHPPPNGAINMAYMDNSYSNSNNGGSVNSQDSLWQVKSGGGVAPATAPDNRSYGNPDNRSYGNPDNRSYGNPDNRSYGNPDNRSYGNPDSRSYGNPDTRSYGQPDNRSYGQPDARQFSYDPNNYDPAQANYNPDVPMHGGYGDYAHYQPQAAAYPTHDEYGRPYEADPYDPVGRSSRPHHTDGGYREVSGLPDPYAGHEADNKPQISFDESLESGYSTPNSRSRRVIREIIV